MEISKQAQEEIRRTLSIKHPKILPPEFEYLDELVAIIHIKDGYTRNHSDTVRELTIEIATVLGVRSSAALQLMSMGAWLHDIGKILVPSSILNKEGKLTEKEEKIVRHHTVSGANLVKDEQHFGPRIAPIILYHHERVDGKWYFGLVGEEIPRSSRIISVADTYDAMDSTRPYRKKLSESFIKQELVDTAGRQLDPVIVDAFFEVMGWTSENLSCSNFR